MPTIDGDVTAGGTAQFVDCPAVSIMTAVLPGDSFPVVGRIIVKHALGSARGDNLSCLVESASHLRRPLGRRLTEHHLQQH